MNNTIDRALAIDREAPYWTWAMFYMVCPVCNSDIDTGERVYFIPETGFKLCQECGKKTAVYEQLTLTL